MFELLRKNFITFGFRIINPIDSALAFLIVTLVLESINLSLDTITFSH